MLVDWIILIVKIGVVLLALMGAVPFLVLAERKFVAFAQNRPGPNRVGPWGLLQTIMDGIKLLLKEDMMPANVDRLLFRIAPIVTMLPALSVFAVIPFGPDLYAFGRVIRLQITDINVAVLYILSITSVGVYGIVLSGWSSNNKYSLLGGLRASAQMISYEVPMGLAIISLALMAGSFSLREIVHQQAGGLWNWYLVRWDLLILPAMVAGVIFLICSFAETNRAPFDLPEAETELVAGYHTEYSSMKFAMFFMAEYANMVNVAAVFTTLFLGGFHGPLPIFSWLGLEDNIPSWLKVLNGLFWFVGKIIAIQILFFWTRATLPRLRYDQLMNFAWKRLVPIAMVNIIVIAAVMAVMNRGRRSATPGAQVAAVTQSAASAPRP
jgi:NADH-quinone oxidoreductase subunit H